MLTPRYFKTDFDQQRRALKGPASVEISLVNGRQYWIFTIREIRDGYILLEVYPEKRGMEFSGPGDQVALPYESIVEVRLTRDVPDDGRVYGFSEQ